MGGHVAHMEEIRNTYRVLMHSKKNLPGVPTCK